jgi:cytochrome c
MSRPALLILTALALTSCSESAPSAPAAPARPAPTEAEKAVILASLPAPYNAADLENGRRVTRSMRAART